VPDIDPDRPSQRRLAERLGLSPRTISLALNDRPGVGAATRDRVRREAEREGLMARRRALNLTIGVCVPNLISLNSTEWGNAVIEQASRRGYAVVIQPTGAPDGDERRAAEMFRKIGVEGVILTSSQVGEDFRAPMRVEGIPVVSWATRTTRDSALTAEPACIEVDHWAGAHQAVHHLVAECGRERVVCLCGPDRSTSAKAKLGGFEAALAEARLAPFDVVDPKRYDFQGGYEQLEKLWAPRNGPDALFCYSDEIALGALRYCHTRGIRVPEELSIIGFDDIRISEFANPPLTTVAVPRLQFAELAVRIIADRLYLTHHEPFGLGGHRPYLKYRGTTSRLAAAGARGA